MYGCPQLYGYTVNILYCLKNSGILIGFKGSQDENGHRAPSPTPPQRCH